MRIKTTPVRMLSSKREQKTNVSEEVEKREPLYTVGGNLNKYRPYGKQCEGSSKSKNGNYHTNNNSTSGKSCLTDKKGCKEEMLPALLLLDVNPPTWMTYLDWRRPSCNAENARAAMERTWVCKGILGHWDWEPRSWSIQDFLLHGNNKWLHCYTTWVGAFPYFQPKASQWTQIWNTLASS